MMERERSRSAERLLDMIVSPIWQADPQTTP
jgi:hypothetical protein